MTSFNNQLLSLFGMISGGLIILLSPQWLSSLVLALITMTALTYSYFTYPEKFKLVIGFCTEFLGFCLMLALFISCFMGSIVVFA